MKGDCRTKDSDDSQSRSVHLTAANPHQLYGGTEEDYTLKDLPISQYEMRNMRGFFVHMTNKMSKPITEDQHYQEILERDRNENMISLDSHANIHVWVSGDHLTNIHKVRPVTVSGVGGLVKVLDTVGDHPLFGEIFIDKNNGYNIISSDLVRQQCGYYRRISDDNEIEYLYNKSLRSVFKFDRDPNDGFYKISFRQFNNELRRIFPNMCQQSL